MQVKRPFRGMVKRSLSKVKWPQTQKKTKPWPDSIEDSTTETGIIYPHQIVFLRVKEG